MLRSRIRAILTAWLIAGTLDILCAIFILAKGNAAGVFRYIAKGAIGVRALHGGPDIILLGACIHYFIAFCFTLGYFLVYPYIPLLRKSAIISGLLYGLFVWSFMQFVVLPFTHNVPGPFHFVQVWKGMAVLMVALGIPIALIAERFYSRSVSNAT